MVKDISLLHEEIDNIMKDKEKCKGLFFRGRVSTFHNGNGRLGHHFEVRLLKRKSCKGCETCIPILDDIYECVSMDVDMVILTNIEDGKLYKPRFVVDGTDWESGYVDDYHYEFDEIKE